MDAASFVDAKPNPKIPDFRPGDSVRVHAKVVEGDRQRIQVFEGVILRIKRGGVSSSFTVRRVTHGIGVERVFPYYSPLVDKVEVTRVGRVRRARLYYLRDRLGKAARIKPGSRARFEALTKQGAVAAEAEYIAEYIEEEEEIVEEEPTVEEEMAEEEATAAPGEEEAVVEAEELAAETEPVAEGSALEASAEEEPTAEASTEEPPTEAEEKETTGESSASDDDEPKPTS